MAILTCVLGWAAFSFGASTILVRRFFFVDR